MIYQNLLNVIVAGIMDAKSLNLFVFVSLNLEIIFS